MTWTILRWVWRLEAPLFIGMPPAGTLNRCRPYVPARVLWGALTAEISRLAASESLPDYQQWGSNIARDCRFTYLYPAEKISGEVLAWMPKFEEIIGAHWYRLDGGERLANRDFRRRVLDSRPGTAIEPGTDSASEAALRETECISPWWRHPGSRRQPKAMLLLGYVFLRGNGFREQLENISALVVGGDTRYGLGRLSRVGYDEVPSARLVFGCPVHLDKEDPKIQSDVVWGHALANDESQIKGVRELLGGWNQGRLWRGELAWAPGSSLKSLVVWSIDEYGHWKEDVSMTVVA